MTGEAYLVCWVDEGYFEGYMRGMLWISRTEGWTGGSKAWSLYKGHDQQVHDQILHDQNKHDQLKHDQRYDPRHNQFIHDQVRNDQHFQKCDKFFQPWLGSNRTWSIKTWSKIQYFKHDQMDFPNIIKSLLLKHDQHFMDVIKFPRAKPKTKSTNKEKVRTNFTKRDTKNHNLIEEQPSRETTTVTDCLPRQSLCQEGLKLEPLHKSRKLLQRHSEEALAVTTTSLTIAKHTTHSGDW